MKRRLVIITEIISPYRIPVFNALARMPEIDLHVIFLAETDPTQREWLVYTNEIQFSYEVLPSWRRRLGKFHCLLNWGMRAALRRASPQVILCGGYSYFAAWSALWWARHYRVPMLLWVESTVQDQRSGRALVESFKTKFIRSCHGCVVAGKSSAEYVRQYGVSPNVIFIAPDAVDTSFFTTAATEARNNDAERRHKLNLPQQFFLFVGRLVPQKGIFDLLRAYSRLASELQSQWGLVFVGSGPAEPELRKQVAALKSGSVQLAGFAQREQLADYYGLAEAFVFPTHTDPWGLVVNEAMACGLPIIISSAAGCAADLVRDRWNGLVVAPKDVAGLASAMTTIAQSAKLRAEMREHSLELIKQYSPEACAAGIAKAALSAGDAN